jgi:hypothetical protein
MTEIDTQSAAHPGAESGAPIVATKEISAHFKLVFIASCIFTAAFLAAWLSMAVFCNAPTPAMTDALNGCKLFAGSGFGAILGLFGGKVS